ncbi:MAG: LamG domain-containing protein [Anaerolineae bacterium]|nr:LamG domain-containing protein [Anaerolineae bacterium]
MLDNPVIIGNGRIDFQSANSVTAKLSYQYHIRTDGLKFFNPTNQAIIDAFELVEQVLGGQFTLKDTSYARLHIFSSSLDTPFSANLLYNQETQEISLNITYNEPFGPYGEAIFEALNIAFIEKKDASNTTFSATGEVTINFINQSIALVAEFDPVAGLQFNYNKEKNPSNLIFDDIGTLALDSLEVKHNKTGIVPPQVLYTFDEKDGETLYDQAGIGEPINLTIEDLDAATWLKQGGLSATPTERSLIASPNIKKGKPNPISDLVAACQRTSELTIEAWVKPANTVQDGPARIVTLSRNTGRRNFTLGQGLWGEYPSDVYDVRVRTETTNRNGLPSTTTPAGTSQTELSQIVFTRNQSGQTRIYVNGIQKVEEVVEGDFSSWDTELCRLGLANEISGKRPWSGEYYKVAIYNRALDATEVAASFAPTIVAKGKMTLDENFGIGPNETFDTTFEYNLLDLTLTSHVNVATDIASQLTFDKLILEWSVPPGETTWQLTGKGQVNLTIFDRPFEFLSSTLPK